MGREAIVAITESPPSRQGWAILGFVVFVTRLARGFILSSRKHHLAPE
jgi:hypothetical protein